MFAGVYAGKNVLVTGHTGFKGSWLCMWLEALGATVSGYSLDYPSEPNHFSLLDLGTSTTIGDVLNQKKFSTQLKRFKPDIVFHLAAQPLVRKSYEKPLDTFYTNVAGTASVLESVRINSSIKAVVNVTTDKVYENHEEKTAYKENDSLGGYDPYSASKACSEIVTASYRQSFFHPDQFSKSHSTLIASARSGNVIGGGDWAEDRLIPDIIRSIQSGTNLKVRYPTATRPWQHVLESLSGYLTLGAHLMEGDVQAATAWNFGPTDNEVSVGTVLEECHSQWPSFNFTCDSATNYHEAQNLQLDSSKASKILHWQNVWDYPKSVVKTIEWYRAFYETDSVVSEAQLQSYINDAKAKGLPWTT